MTTVCSCWDHAYDTCAAQEVVRLVLLRETDADELVHVRECLQERNDDIARLRAALEEIKPLVTGQLPTPIPLEMTARCMRIADIIDASLDAARRGEGA